MILSSASLEYINGNQYLDDPGELLRYMVHDPGILDKMSPSFVDTVPQSDQLILLL